MTTILERRMIEHIAIGEPFTADDITDCGRISIDPHHAPNQNQNTIGSLFHTQSAEHHIEPTGTVTRSRAPHRKGGMIREWQATSAGQRWARLQLEALP